MSLAAAEKRAKCSIDESQNATFDFSYHTANIMAEKASIYRHTALTY
jgi:hypothetical protein